MKYLLGYNGDPPMQIVGPQGIESFDLLGLLARTDAAETVVTDSVTNLYVANPVLINAWTLSTQPAPPSQSTQAPPQASS